MAVAKDLLDSVVRTSFDNVRWLLDDVGDDDCFWEPATPCWSVRPRDDAGAGWGTGPWVRGELAAARPAPRHLDRSAQDRFTSAVSQLDDADLAERRPAHWGPRLPIYRLVSTIAVEHVHHGAEIGLLRDLRRGHGRVQPPPIAAG